ncbi:MAG TPA: cytochrome c1 [Patescibacteria group bacterium]|nr:cytochrome c1 [Patescibacteria group bacterium]
MKNILPLLAAAVLLCAATAAPASEGEELKHQKWPHQGVFGTYDKAALQRGFQVYKEVCAACHSMKLLSYRDLQQLGYTPEQVKAVAAENTIQDGPNDEGEMFDRPARPADRFRSPFANDKAARAANNGALPPDLSLLVKAREHGEDYVFALLNGYEDAPADVQVMPGLNYNKVFPGHQIAMAKPLNDGQVAYGDGTANTLDQEARDVAQFLAWAAEPHMEQRKSMGIKVMLFMFAFCAIMLAAKRKVWSTIH